MPCRMSPKSNIQVQSNPMENHSTGMLMNVMEIPRAKMTLARQKHHLFPVCKARTQSPEAKAVHEEQQKKIQHCLGSSGGVSPPASKPSGVGKYSYSFSVGLMRKREAMGVSCSQGAWVEGGDREDTIPVSPNTGSAWEQRPPRSGSSCLRVTLPST